VLFKRTKRSHFARFSNYALYNQYLNEYETPTSASYYPDLSFPSLVFSQLRANLERSDASINAVRISNNMRHKGVNRLGKDPTLWLRMVFMDKTESNRRNARRSTGPRNTTSTRFNAINHGLLAKGLTELDDSGAYESLIQRLTEFWRPIGDLEVFQVERIGFHMIRIKRAGRLEAEYITGEIHPTVMTEMLEDVWKPEVIKAGLPAAIGALSATNLVSGFQRYETALENKLYRAINQLERLQRARRGEFVPAPESIDVSMHSERERDV
jgi:hypothetical protein